MTMGELVNRHVVKIQLGVLMGVLATVLYFIFNVSSFVSKVDASETRLKQVEKEIVKVPLLEQNIGFIRMDISDIKTDLKEILKSK